MERLEKLVNILMLTPHRQPELVKEASHRILSRQLRTDSQIGFLLKPILEILIQYCDDNDSAQRSLFNDYLNSVILTFQNQYYQLILNVLLDKVSSNGSARTITAALQRIPHLVNNVKPIELGYEPQKLLKSLVEIARRSDDESVQASLGLTLKHVMPYLEYYVRKNKDVQFLTNALVEVLFRNLQNESSQTKRLAAISIANICHSSEIELKDTLKKLETQLDVLASKTETTSQNIFAGLCLCIKEMPEVAEHHQNKLIAAILNQIELNPHDITLMNPALETLRDILRYKVSDEVIESCVQLILHKFLLDDNLLDGSKVMKKDIKVTLQANALSCLSSIIRHCPSILDRNEALFLFKDHSDVAVRNQLILIIGNYIEASWKFPQCIEQSTDCERIRKLWVELKSILHEDSTHPDTMKSCIIAIRNCINLLLESDHCLHIVEYQDIDNIINLYLRSNFKPFRVEVLSLFASLNYRTIHYLERSHWSKMRAQTAGSMIDSLQDRIVNNILIASLIDEHQKIRIAASNALINIVPNLYVTNLNNGPRNIPHRCSDPIVSLADDLASEHLVVLEQADEHINHFNGDDEPAISSELHETSCIKNGHKFLSSSIIQSYDNPYNEQTQTQIDVMKSQHRVGITINLMYVVGLLKLSIESSLDKGKTAISSIVKTFYELSLVYPVSQYATSWDCRPSEYCESFTLLNFLLSYLENLNEPDVIVEDLEAYRNFLAFSQQLLYALCHESVLHDYEHQKMKPFHKRQAEFREGQWPELTLRQPSLSETLQVFFSHLTKLLWLASYIIEEKSNPFAMSSAKQPGAQNNKISVQESLVSHDALTSNRFLFGRIHRKLESSFKSSKKNLNQKDEKFFQILETCLSGISSLLEFVGMNKSSESCRDLLGYLRITSTTCGPSSIICVRQLLKSLFGINILALYQVDPNDWFEEEAWVSSPSNMISQHEISTASMQGVYHHLVSNPYKIFSNYYSINCSRITPTSDKALAVMNYESRRALKVRRRIEERVRSLFEFNPTQPISPRVRQISEILKNTITEFTPIVTDCMNNFMSKGFNQYQRETLHLMSYLILLRVNYQKLPQAQDFVNGITKLLDHCGEKMFSCRQQGISILLRTGFTFLTLLTYERGPSKPMFLIPTVIQKFDDLRAKLSISSVTEQDISTYVVPLLRCLVEDLFIYRTKNFQSFGSQADNKIITSSSSMSGDTFELQEHQPSDPYKKDVYEILEAERETVAQKLLDVIDNPEVYDLLSILILESRQNSSEIKYKKLSRHLLSIIPKMLLERKVNLTDYKRIELTRRIIENISPEVFQPVNFIFETLLEAPKPSFGKGPDQAKEFQRWMSLVIIAIHILTTQVKEEVFLARLKETMPDEVFVKYLLHIAQLCISEIFVHLYDSTAIKPSNVQFLIQQLSCYILYLTHMFQSGLFFQLSRSAVDFLKKEIKRNTQGPSAFESLCTWSRNPNTGFCLNACELMFFHIKLVQPDLTIFWSNVMMLLNNVDCNRDYWRYLLVYECHHCQVQTISKCPASSLTSPSFDDAATEVMSDTREESSFKRNTHINRPSSLNLSDISFSDQLRRSFIKKIAVAETRDKALNRNIIETSGEDGQLLEREVNIGNTEQCLSPNIELTRRGVLCLVLDFVTVSMNDVEHITWLIIHHINDIIRWSHEMPITEFISAVHGNSASSGIFIQAINTGYNNLTSISLVTRLLWTLEQVHYTQYGSLVVLLVEKLLSSHQLMPYRSLTRSIEEFACSTVQKLLNETNKSLVTTNEEVINQLTVEDLDRIISMLDSKLYPSLTKLLTELRETSRGQSENPTIELHMVKQDSDDDSDEDEVETLYSKSNLIYWLAEQNGTANISTLMPALNTLQNYLADPLVTERLIKDEVLVSFLVTAIYSLALNILPPPTRLVRPRLWLNGESKPQQDLASAGKGAKEFTFDKLPPLQPSLLIGTKRPVIKAELDKKPFLSRDANERTEKEVIDAVRSSCLKALFLVENLDYLNITQYEFLEEIIIRLARLPIINPFVLTPPQLWRQNIWPLSLDEKDTYKTNFPMVTHDILIKDYGILENFCDRLLKLGWINRRQFEEAWMTLLGVLSSSLSQTDTSGVNSSSPYGSHEAENKRINLLAAKKTVTTITRLLLMTRKRIMGDPTSEDLYPVQGFDERVIELTKAIGSNLSALNKKTQNIFESLESDRGGYKAAIKKSNSDPPPSPKSIANESINNSGFSNYLRIPAQKLRMNSILNLEIGMQETVIIDNDQNDTSFKSEEVDVESCIRLLLTIYKQKIKDPSESLISAKDSSTGLMVMNQSTPLRSQTSIKDSRANQLAPPLTSTIAESVLALSDMFTDYEQYDWLFETFIHMFRLAEYNEDKIQMQSLILGLCKATTVCCYEVPSELTTASTINHRDVMFEKCRQSIENCVKSEFGPLKMSALYGAYYLLEDSINIVASGAWELDHFKRLRQSRLAWILKLMPIILNRDNAKLLTKKTQIMKLLEALCETVTESELKAIKP